MDNAKLVIFDLDGTLVDAYQAIAVSFNYSMRRLKYPCQTDEVIRRAVGSGDENLLRPFVRKADLKRALLIYRQHHSLSLVRYSRLFPRVKKLLRYLKLKGSKLAVASNRPTRFSRILVRHLGLKKYFDYVLCADRLKNRKPHPEILKRIMCRFSVKPREVIYVGDMTVDAQAGRRAKVITVMVTTGSSTRKELKNEKPSYIIPAVWGLRGISLDTKL
ncbi:MAG: HAD family hydrolase [Candidatus Omnitrophota bacterium]|nr:HAD family hydrolase [Candidatus Omnitrophota bacterium]MBU1928234.1 HAD family hydrolase [Candidatus Omnitrophota bacterium]MBU2034428.1 HAD family hydrolase [Candidatus Omnitrophota bacterium]MBU2258609.1 HAD family hydrolase [Candidatus Omnitrophota bacterium]